jgi:hypothetical protein
VKHAFITGTECRRISIEFPSRREALVLDDPWEVSSWAQSRRPHFLIAVRQHPMRTIQLRATYYSPKKAEMRMVPRVQQTRLDLVLMDSSEWPGVMSSLSRRRPGIRNDASALIGPREVQARSNSSVNIGMRHVAKVRFWSWIPNRRGVCHAFIAKPQHDGAAC